jgi:hypothetical protein
MILILRRWGVSLRPAKARSGNNYPRPSDANLSPTGFLASKNHLIPPKHLHDPGHITFIKRDAGVCP